MSKYELDLAKYAKLSRQTTAESCVLLKNDNKTLPIRKGSNKNYKSIFTNDKRTSTRNNLY